MIQIDHDGNLSSVYEHLSPDMYVKKGEIVEKGEVIAKVGPKFVDGGKLNGATTGVHLHFGVTKNGKAIDPLVLYNRK